MAELFDISCLANTPLFDAMPDIAIAAWKPLTVTTAEIISIFHKFKITEVLGKEFFGGSPLNVTSLISKVALYIYIGQHYYVPTPNGGTGLSPKWDFTSSAFKGNPNAFVVAAKVNQVAAPGPTGSQDIDWVSLKRITGELAQEVYRTDTRLGQPPANVSRSHCVPKKNKNILTRFFFFKKKIVYPWLCRN